MKNAALTATLLLLFFPFVSFAWGREGHTIVADIAARYMKPETRLQVQAVLGTTSFAEAASWMDDRRDDHQYDYMKPWHYVNVEKGGVYSPGPQPDVVSKLKDCYALLKAGRADAEATRTALLVLFHLAGDVHQPLHAGYGSDKGGNTMQVQYHGSGTNLHRIWDTELIRSQDITLADCLKLGSTLDKTALRGIRKVDPLAWMVESRTLLPEVYGFSGHKLDDAYAARCKPLAERQLLYAGIRLAAMLDEVCKGRKLPVAVPAKTVTGADVAVPAAEGRYSAAEAAAHIGERTTVCGKVYNAKFLSPEGPTFLNMGAAYPGNPFTVVIYAKSRDNFSYRPEQLLEGKNICVTGKVIDYKGKAEIIVNSEADIRVE